MAPKASYVCKVIRLWSTIGWLAIRKFRGGSSLWVWSRIFYLPACSSCLSLLLDCHEVTRFFFLYPSAMLFLFRGRLTMDRNMSQNQPFIIFFFLKEKLRTMGLYYFIFKYLLISYPGLYEVVKVIKHVIYYMEIFWVISLSSFCCCCCCVFLCLVIKQV